MNEMTQRLEGLLASGKDSALMRCTLGKAYLDGDAPAVAHSHLQRATELDPGYSVAWKLLGRALLALDDASGLGRRGARGWPVRRKREMPRSSRRLVCSSSGWTGSSPPECGKRGVTAAKGPLWPARRPRCCGDEESSAVAHARTWPAWRGPDRKGRPAARWAWWGGAMAPTALPGRCCP